MPILPVSKGRIGILPHEPSEARIRQPADQRGVIVAAIGAVAEGRPPGVNPVDQIQVIAVPYVAGAAPV